MDDIAVLIACRDEERTISKVVGDFRSALPGAVVYVYDNNSSDCTAEVAASAGAVVRFEGTRGKGAVTRRMFREIEARCYLLVDGDDTYPASAAGDLVAPVLEGRADMVVGDRLSSTYAEENKRPFHVLGNRLVRWAVKTVFGADVHDVMTGYRALSRQFVKSFAVLTDGFEVETEMTIHAADKRMRTENVVVSYRNRPEGSVSKLNTLTDGASVLALIMRLFFAYRPLASFGIVAAVLGVLAAAFVAPVLVAYAQTGLVERLPTLVVCCFVLLAALLSLFAGVVCSCLRRSDLEAFEMRLLEIARDDS